MATQTPEPILNQFYVLGSMDYPRSTHYPTQDKYTPTDEAEYNRGWRHAAIQHKAEEDYDGRNIWGDY